MHIEKVSLSEKAQELFEMDVKTFIRDFDYPATKLENTVEYLQGCEIFFVYEDDKPIGSFSYKEVDGQVEVVQVALLPPYQGKGYGKKMVEYLLNLVKGKPVWLVTHPKNTPAIITYLKSGFVLTEWKDNYYGDGQPRLLFRLNPC
jgi:ribosomal protein S18 acetylase RimI-like enzyme